MFDDQKMENFVEYVVTYIRKWLTFYTSTFSAESVQNCIKVW